MNTRPFDASLSAVVGLVGLAALADTHAGGGRRVEGPGGEDWGHLYNLSSGSQASLGRPSLNGSMLAVEQLNAPRRAARPSRRARSPSTAGAIRRGSSKETKKLVRTPRAVGDHRPERHDHGPRGCADRREGSHGVF